MVKHRVWVYPENNLCFLLGTFLNDGRKKSCRLGDVPSVSEVD